MTSTALVPVKMYDAKVLDVIRHLQVVKSFVRTPVKQLGTAKAVQAIKATVQGICIEGAISILAAFNYGNCDFHLNKQVWRARDLANEHYFPDLQGRLAHETPVFWFWGGPPTKLKWYEGTLQTLLEDRLLCEIQERGVEKVAEYVGVDLETLV